MENATQALIIGGGILLAILLISTAVYLFSTYGGFADSYDQRQSSQELAKFNSNFTKFEGRQDITAQEIVTLVNFIKVYNEQNETNIEVKVQGLNYVNKTEAELLDFIKNNSTYGMGINANIVTFRCSYIDLENPDRIGFIRN